MQHWTYLSLARREIFYGNVELPEVEVEWHIENEAQHRPSGVFAMFWKFVSSPNLYVGIPTPK